MRYTTGAFGLVLSLLLWGCSSSGVNDAPTVASGSLSDVYTIGVGDELRINVWKNPELSVDVPVRPDGKISIPLIGDIRASERTAPELAEQITKGLKTYIRSPQVTVIVASAGSVDFQRRVRITGAVETPVSIPHRDGMTVLDLVLEAGGPTEFAAPNRAKLYRKVDGEMKVYSIYLDDLLLKGELESNYKLAPSDIITVPERLL
jgi:polysaccharide export outer membrane protein